MGFTIVPTVSMAGVLRKLARGVRFLWPDPEVPLPGDRAIAYHRKQVGARPLDALFKQVCRPSATPQTRGAFRFGLRLMALDGTGEAVADTPAKARAFGRHTGNRGDSAFPQLQDCCWHAARWSRYAAHFGQRIGQITHRHAIIRPDIARKHATILRYHLCWTLQMISHR